MITSTAARRVATTAVAALVVIGALAGCESAGQSSVVSAVNNDRAAAHVASLAANATIDGAAQKWADHMASTGALAGSNLASDLSGVRYCAAAENVGRGSSVASVEAALMANATYRGNIVSSAWSTFGVGFTQKGSAVYVVQIFVKTC